MNEIKQIHLGRQPFTISVDAHRELRAYLEAIEHQAGSKSEVVKDVELRMAELLTERGIKGDKVVLPEDVAFLKEQLGEPRDFKDESPEAEGEDSEGKTDQGPKRLYRDTENAMVAGVSSGLAAYFGIDAVIIRLIFILLTFSGGAGILAYLILWIVVPEAKSNSDRLQMRGKAVTVDSLKEVVDRADVQGAATRASRVVGRVIEKSAQVALAIIGAAFVTAAIPTFLAITVAASYLLIHGGQIAGEVVYPIGVRAVVSLICAVVVGWIIASALLFIGLAMIKRRWTVPGWVAAAALGVFIVAASVGTAIGFDIAPAIQDKYDSMHHTQTYNTASFNKLKVVGSDIATFEYKPSNTYFVEVQYFGSPKRDLGVSSQVQDSMLTVDASKYKSLEECTFFCFYSDNNIRVIIHAPKLDDINVEGTNTYFFSDNSLQQAKLHVTVAGNNSVDIEGVAVATIEAKLSGSTREVTLDGLRPSPDSSASAIRFSGDSLVSSDNVSDTFMLSDNPSCDEYQPLVYLDTMPKSIMVEGKTIESRDALTDLRSSNQRNVYNCIVVRDINGNL
jgi:phage shock protein PspC (stress-responsive transcriptional regulator)